MCGVLVLEGHSEEPWVESRHTAQRREHNSEDREPGLLMRASTGDSLPSPRGFTLESEACLLLCIFSGLRSHTHGLSLPQNSSISSKKCKCYQLAQR